jgi:hypothetical protein
MDTAILLSLQHRENEKFVCRILTDVLPTCVERCTESSFTFSIILSHVHVTCSVLTQTQATSSCMYKQQPVLQSGLSYSIVAAIFEGVFLNTVYYFLLIHCP